MTSTASGLLSRIQQETGEMYLGQFLKLDKPKREDNRDVYFTYKFHAYDSLSQKLTVNNTKEDDPDISMIILGREIKNNEIEDYVEIYFHGDTSYQPLLRSIGKTNGFPWMKITPDHVYLTTGKSHEVELEPDEFLPALSATGLNISFSNKYRVSKLEITRPKSVSYEIKMGHKVRNDYKDCLEKEKPITHSHVYSSS